MSLANNLSCEFHWDFLQLQQPPHVFTVRGFEALFPHAGILDCVVCLAPQLFLPVYPHANMGLPGPSAAASPGLPVTTRSCRVSSPPQLPDTILPTSLDECFVFNSLVVRLPCSSIFLAVLVIFFVFKFVFVLLLLLYEEESVSAYASILA